MKKIILSALFMMSLSVTAFANSTNAQVNNNLKNVISDYTCTYEYYEEVIDGSGNITYIFVGSEVVECGAEDAGQVFAYVFQQNSLRVRADGKIGPGTR